MLGWCISLAGAGEASQGAGREHGWGSTPRATDLPRAHTLSDPSPRIIRTAYLNFAPLSKFQSHPRDGFFIVQPREGVSVSLPAGRQGF